ncbi:MAG: DUF5719 family protein [Acidimicrobiia bacterium]|nr:DUF5719 family protein [Acidimicrobiia bacterium]
MRRIVGLGLAALLMAGAWVLEPPPALDPDLAAVTTTAEEDLISTSRFSHCSWAFADGDVDTAFALAALAEVEYQLSFPAGGELSQEEPQVLASLGAVSIPLSSFRVQGEAPAIIEFSDGPSAVGVVAQGDTELSAATCPSSLPKVWSVPGGSTDDGVQFVMRLLNPFAEDARVTIRGTSELGSEALPGFENMTVPARASRTILVHEEIPGRATVSLTIEQIEGSVIPMAELSDGTDLAVWPGVRQSETWELPLTGLGSAPGDLVLSNDALVDVSYTIDIFGEDGSVTTGPSGSLPGPGTVRIPMDATFAEGLFGVRVSADGPISAALALEGDGGRGVAVGLPTVSNRWLIPGPNAEPAAQYEMWLLNSGVDDVAVRYQYLDAAGDAVGVTEVVVPATSVLSVPATQAQTAAVLVDASAPISVTYSASRGRAIAVGEAVRVGE